MSSVDDVVHDRDQLVRDQLSPRGSTIILPAMRLRYLASGLAAAAVLAAATAAPAGAATAAPAADWPSWAVQGTLYRAAPLYPTSPDSWQCHFGGDCRPAGVRYTDDPDPINTLQPGQQVRVRCQFGDHVWAEVEPDRTEIGWLAVNTLSLNGSADSCGLADWGLGWRRWG